MLEAHEGRIWVESSIGLGSTFTFSLPVCDLRRLRRHTGQGAFVPLHETMTVGTCLESGMQPVHAYAQGSMTTL
jgi:hypothetical protein